MTILTVYADHDGGVWLGSDTRGSFANGRVFCTGRSKWVIDSGRRLALAVGGYARLAAVTGEHVESWAGVDDAAMLVDSIRAAVIEDGWEARTDDGEHRSWPFEALLVCASGVYAIDNAFAYYRVPAGVPAAMGSGDSYALGAAHYALRAGHDDPAHLTRAMLEAAAAHDAACGHRLIVQRLVLNGSLTDQTAPPGLLENAL